MHKFYLNLTNGLAYLPTIKQLGSPYGFLRIQSTACEQKLWDNIIMDLDADLLINLALGTDCVVLDTGTGPRAPRALEQGLGFVRFAINANWGLEKGPCKVWGQDSEKYFVQCYQHLSQKARNKLRYYRRFLSVDKIRLAYDWQPTFQDGNYEHWVRLVQSEVQVG